MAAVSREGLTNDPFGDRAGLEGEVVIGDLTRELMSRASDREDHVPQGRRVNSRPTVSVVIPAFNEEPNLPFVLPSIGGWIDEVILVDGSSTDATCHTARTLRNGIRVIEQDGTGKGAALRSGFEAATGDIIVMLDADGSTSPREIPVFVGALASGAEFAKGTRFAQGGGSADLSPVRRAGNRALVLLVRLLFGGHFSDLCYGYVAFWKRILPQLELGSTGFEVETEMSLRALRARLRIVEVPSFEYARVHGKSNLRTIPDGWSVLRLIIRERMRRPHTRRDSTSTEPVAAEA